MSVLEAPPSHERLLFGVSESRWAPDLGAHQRRFGPCPFPSPRPSPSPPLRERFEAELKASGLTGRGGAQFQVATKLAAVRSRRRHGVVVVNSMEGEPASWKDATLADHAPHLVLDGAEFMAVALGSSQVWVCIHRTIGPPRCGRMNPQ